MEGSHNTVVVYLPSHDHVREGDPRMSIGRFEGEKKGIEEGRRRQEEREDTQDRQDTLGSDQKTAHPHSLLVCVGGASGASCTGCSGCSGLQ